MSDCFDSAPYQRSRSVYRIQCTLEYFISLLITDAYLAKLLTYLGLSDSLAGVVSSLSSAAFLFQLLAIPLVQRMRNTKRTCVIAALVSQSLFLSLYFIPFLPVSSGIRKLMVVGGLLVGHMFQHLVGSVQFKWGNSFVDPQKRAAYSAGKEMLSLLSGMAFTLIVGRIIDRYEGLDNLEGGFLFIAITSLCLTICNFISLLMIAPEPAAARPREHIPMKTVLCRLAANRNFCHVVLLTVIWEVGRCLTLGFLGTYKIKELALTVGTVQLINILGDLCRFGISKPFGRYSDRTSYAKGIELAMWITAASFLAVFFCTPETRWCIAVQVILYKCSLAGSNQNFLNIIYSYVPAEYFVQASAVKSSIAGTCGFLASLAGARILALVQENGNSVLGFSLHGQQLLAILSALIILTGVVYNRKVILPQSVMKQ